MSDRPSVVLLPGDGIGPEVTAVAVRTLAAAGFEADWIERPIGWNEWCERGEALPTGTLEAMRSAGAALLGAVTSKTAAEAEAALTPRLRGTGLRYRSPVVRLRRELDLYAGLRPARSAGIDILTVRESTEDLYAGVEDGPEAAAAMVERDPRLGPWSASGRVATTTRVVSERACERIARAAFEAASRRGETRVVLTDKPNIARATGALFVEVARRVAAGFPGVELAVENIDATCMKMAMDPSSYGVVLAANLFGDIVSDLAAGLTGGPGLAASASVGASFAVFEPVHGSAPDIAGRGSANPIAAVRAGAMLAARLGREDVASRLERAVDRVLAAGEPADLTPDLGGSGGTENVAGAILRELEAPIGAWPS